jgi:hypothetical protein
MVCKNISIFSRAEGVGIVRCIRPLVLMCGMTSVAWLTLRPLVMRSTQPGCTNIKPFPYVFPGVLPVALTAFAMKPRSDSYLMASQRTLLPMMPRNPPETVAQGARHRIDAVRSGSAHVASSSVAISVCVLFVATDLL